MAFSEEDRIVIQYLPRNQNYSAKRFIMEIPDKRWKLGVGILIYPLHKIDKTGSCVRRSGSGRPRTARTNENIDESRRQSTQTHLTQRGKSQEIGISRTNVNEIVKLRLKCFKKRRATEGNESTCRCGLSNQDCS